MKQGAPSRAIVIGGGITGLVAAYRLQQAGIRVTLLEKTARVGGCIRTVKQDGFLMEDGPDSFVARKPAARMLCEELGLELQGTLPQPHRAYILRRGSLIPLPDGFSGLVPSKLGPFLKTPLLSARGKLRLMLDFVVPPRRREEDESVASFFRRRIGREAFQELVEPLIGGISGGNPEELSLKAAFPQLREAEKKRRSLIRALQAISPGDDAFLTIKGGIESLPRAICARLQDVRLLSPVHSVEKGTGTEFVVCLKSGDRLVANAVAIATPARTAFRILHRLNSEIATCRSSLCYNPVAIAHLAYDSIDGARPLDAYGYIVPRKERRNIAACTWTSSKLPGRAPRDKTLLRVFLARAFGHDSRDLSAPELIDHVMEELRLTLGIGTAPILTRVWRWYRSSIRLNVGQMASIDRLRHQLETDSTLTICGASVGKYGLSDCILDAERSARLLIQSGRFSTGRRRKAVQ